MITFYHLLEHLYIATSANILFMLHGIMNIDFQLFIINLQSQSAPIHIYHDSPRFQEWSSQNYRHLFIFWHFKNYKIYRKHKLIHFHKDVLDYSVRSLDRMIRKLESHPSVLDCTNSQLFVDG